MGCGTLHSLLSILRRAQRHQTVALAAFIKRIMATAKLACHLDKKNKLNLIKLLVYNP